MKKNNKGFTLVELIVVLVILAILAAILVPALLGYIDKAREGQYAEEAHSILVAMQAYETEQYGKNATAPSVPSVDYINNIVSPTVVTSVGTVYTGSAASGGQTKHKSFTISGVNGLTFTSQSNKTIECSFDGTEWVITKIDNVSTGKTAPSTYVGTAISTTP